jgi:hypothetical protein
MRPPATSETSWSDGAEYRGKLGIYNLTRTKLPIRRQRKAEEKHTEKNKILPVELAHLKNHCYPTPMQNYTWAERFKKVYDAAVLRYNNGTQNAKELFSKEDVEFLASIGCSAQELFDFVEDFCRGGEPIYSDVLLVTAVRRDYFLNVQHGKPSGKVIDSDKLPAKSAELGGISWLPRIIEKAQAKLHGEMPPELMYGCGGDRPFLRGVNIHLADFLRFVWQVDGDQQKVLAYVNENRGKK